MVGFSMDSRAYSQHSINAAITIPMILRKVLATTEDCPFCGVGPAGDEPLPLIVGHVTGGRGGSITSLSDKIGFGASVGGKLAGIISGRRPPGWTGAMYKGVSLYHKHLFPPCSGNHGNWNFLLCFNGYVSGLQLENMNLRGKIDVDSLVPL